MKQVLFFLSPYCGGAERITITIAKLLDRVKYDVRFVVIGREIGEIKKFVPDDYPLYLIKIWNIYDFTTLRIIFLLRRLCPSYVFSSLHYLNPRVLIASRLIGGCKTVLRFNCEVNRVKGINKWLTKLTYPKADIIVAQTEKMQADLEQAFGLTRGNVTTIHNLIDEDTIISKLLGAENPYKEEKSKVVVWVGRYDPVKCTDIVVKAFIEACKRDNTLNLYMVGKIDPRSKQYQKVHNIVEQSTYKDNIHFLGFQDNPYKWVKNAGCFILASRSEGSPNALFEALYLGVPSVVTRCTPNIDDIIHDGKNGYKVEIGDYKMMSKRILEALNLGKVKSIYKHSTKEDFIELFK